MVLPEAQRSIILKDSTLREGLDTPGVVFSREQKWFLLDLLAQAKVSEAEVVAPSRVLADVACLSDFSGRGAPLKMSGLIYCHSSQWREEVRTACGYLSRVDLLMPLSARRRPFEPAAKIDLLLQVLDYALSCGPEVGVGFPQATQGDRELLVTMGKEALRRGAQRITIYDTNGSAEPWGVFDLLTALKQELPIPLFFHGHNDLGLATANSLAAARAGAAGLEVTVNGLGDRAGNASLEQVALNLHLQGYSTGIELGALPALSRAVAAASGIPLGKLAPVVGEYVFAHKSPAHLEHPDLFEAFDPGLVGGARTLVDP